MEIESQRGSNWLELYFILLFRTGLLHHFARWDQDTRLSSLSFSLLHLSYVSNRSDRSFPLMKLRHTRKLPSLPTRYSIIIFLMSLFNFDGGYWSDQINSVFSFLFVWVTYCQLSRPFVLIDEIQKIIPIPSFSNFSYDLDICTYFIYVLDREYRDRHINSSPVQVWIWFAYL
jgi:hypothetical protein